MLLALIAAGLAGVAAWLVGEWRYDYYKPSEEAASQAYSFAALNAEMEVVSSYNGATAFGALGALLGLALGLAGGLTRGSLRGGLAAAVVGLVLGGLAGALPAFAVMPWDYRHRNDDPGTLDLSTPLLTHLGLWCALGATAGLAYGLGRGGARPGVLVRGLLGGLIGASVGTVAFELIGAAAFPTDRTTYPIGLTATTRLLARMFVALLAAGGAGRAGPTPPPAGEAPPPPGV
jgi:hypothetical protein